MGPFGGVFAVASKIPRHKFRRMATWHHAQVNGTGYGRLAHPTMTGQNPFPNFAPGSLLTSPAPLERAKSCLIGVSRVNQVSQAVAQQVESENRQTDHHARINHELRFALEKQASLVEHGSPF